MEHAIARHRAINNDNNNNDNNKKIATAALES